MENPKLKVALASDHGGFKLKNEIIRHLKSKNIEHRDFGCCSEESCDYPEFAQKACEAVTEGEFTFGILVCSTGIGISMAANKCRGIRAACCSDTYSARFTRLHNDANVLCMGEKVVGIGLALDMVDLFISTDFEGGRHSKRVQMIMDIEKQSVPEE